MFLTPADLPDACAKPKNIIFSGRREYYLQMQCLQLLDLDTVHSEPVCEETQFIIFAMLVCFVVL